MKRRGFLKFVASLLPASVVINKVIGEEKKDTLLPETPTKKYPVIEHPKIKEFGTTVGQADISFFCDKLASRGSVVELADYERCPSGGYYAVTRPGFHTGQPIGVLLQDVVEFDASHYNSRVLNKIDIPIGGKVSILQQGSVFVGRFDEQVEMGEKIYYNEKGCMTTEDTGRAIGVALSGTDEEGFANVHISLYFNENVRMPK